MPRNVEIKARVSDRPGLEALVAAAEPRHHSRS